jgi:hypothetical protein
VPIRTVLLTQLCKFNGQKTGILSARDFPSNHRTRGAEGLRQHRLGRGASAGARDREPAPREEAGRRWKKFVKRKPPERNFVNWDEKTFTRLIHAPPERLASQFQVSHGMLLNVLSRPSDGCAAMQQLISRSHEAPKAKKALTRRAWQLFRGLVERGIVEFIPKTADGAKLRVNVTLQEDFSMNQTLSLYLHDTLPLIDPQAPDYALVVLTLVESIIEDPDLILRRQLDKVKGQAVAEMKMQGIQYDQRMEELEKLEYPKPNRDFIYSTFNDFAARHPWVGQENIRPKSIAREMFEEFRSFADYIKIYELQRAEGCSCDISLPFTRSSPRRSPTPRKNDALHEMELYLATMLRQIDSSLLEEWEKMRDPNYVPRGESKEVRPPGAEEAARDITRDRKAFTAAIRNRIFTFLRALVSGDYETALTISTRQLQPKRSHGRRSDFAKPWTSTSPSTRCSVSIPRRAIFATPTSSPPTMGNIGFSSRCSSTPPS